MTDTSLTDIFATDDGTCPECGEELDLAGYCATCNEKEDDDV